MFLPNKVTPCSFACPVKLCTLCKRLSLDLAGLEGALIVLAFGFKFNDISLVLAGGGAPVPGGPVVAVPCIPPGAAPGPVEGTPGLTGA